MNTRLRAALLLAPFFVLVVVVSVHFFTPPASWGVSFAGGLPIGWAYQRMTEGCA